MKDFKDFLNELGNEESKPKKERRYPLTPEQLKRYNDAHEDNCKVKYPNLYADGHYCKPVIPQYQTANGLTSFIIDYLTWTGQYANRITSEGRTIMKDGKPIRIKSSTRAGTEDIDTIINGRPVKIEIKINDRQSEKQKQHEKSIQKAGGYYFIVRTVTEFFDIYDKFMSAPKMDLFL